MTNEEAIKRLKEFKILHTEQAGWDVTTLKALDMAIKALEQKSKYRKEARRWKNKALGQQKTGHWISKGDIYPAWKYCSKCKEPWTFDCGTPNFCPNCSAKMESEDKE